MKMNCLVLAAMLVISLGAYVTEAAAAIVFNCQTINQPGSYFLFKNLTGTGNCLVVQADYVTIDLAGFSITGNGTGSGITDNGVARKGITVRNGMINNFAIGIDLLKSFQILIERMHLTNNSSLGAGAGFFGTGDGDTAIVRDSLFYKNGRGLAAGANSVVTNNTASNNILNGISAGTGSTVIGNTANQNGTVGLEVLEFSTVVHNAAQGNGNPGSSGLRIFCPVNLIGNTAVNNGTNLTLIGTGCNSEQNLIP